MVIRAQSLERHFPGTLLESREPERGFIVVSNRGPFEFSMNAEGAFEAHRGAGGVVSGMLCAAGERDVSWIALAMSEADRAVARAVARTRGKATILAAAVPENIALRLVDVPAATYRRYYDSISNRLLWFMQHYLMRPTASGQFSARTAADWERGYRVVNEAVADAVVAELDARGPATPILFQDYHLYLAPERVRALRPDARMAHFVHIPWPDSRYWELLPSEVVQAIFRGLAANDLIGFQTQRDVRNFLEGAPHFLPDARLMRNADGEVEGLEWQGRVVLARAYPIAVTPHEVRTNAACEDASAEAAALCREFDDDMRLIVRVDRVEPTKNIVRGFHAYERLLRQHPEWQGNVTFLALLVPSRQSLREYRDYERQVRRQIERINARYGRPGWQPIVAVFGNHRARALACMRRYDVLLVNPVIDGMNLVVKEGGLTNQRDGVVVLSRTAGAFEQLRDHVLEVAPLDERATAEALHRALTLPADERRERADGIRAVLEAEDAAQWLDSQLNDLEQHVRLLWLARQRATSLRHRVIPADETMPTSILHSSRLSSALASLRDSGDSGDGLAISM